MTTFRKYAFQLQADYEALPTPTGNTVILGDIEGYFCVDVLWESEPNAAYLPYEVWPQPIGIHCFAGWEEQYTKDYTERDNLNETITED
jgi:hypothetical protein